ncbi:MAG TPA: glutathionylspermidine synthase family protein [Methylomirabilota bacterium]|nr:glutathionylspermidine synthase family protein [Methylomirabilota bacterium]
MKRLRQKPREQWRHKVEAVGLTYHTPDNFRYWDESTAYELTSKEVDTLEAAAAECHALCLAAARVIIEQDWFDRLHIPPAARGLIRASWERQEFSLYGRFDFAWDGRTPPKLLEYNADTPTALIEAAVAQWYWLEEMHPRLDQFNSIHERLIAAWKKIAPQVSGRVHFGGLKESEEDEQTVLYLQDTCHQAGLQTARVHIEDLGFHSMRRRFVDLDGQTVSHYFKLYPWEWMWGDEFAAHLDLDVLRFIEPPWKMLLSNKGLLALLWELFPGHPNLAPAFLESDARANALHTGRYVRKPLLSREGANIAIFERTQLVAQTRGDYGQGPHVVQQFLPSGIDAAMSAVFGVWIVDHTPCGLGIREDEGLIIGNTSRFVPHFF